MLSCVRTGIPGKFGGEPDLQEKSVSGSERYRRGNRRELCRIFEVYRLKVACAVEGLMTRAVCSCDVADTEPARQKMCGQSGSRETAGFKSIKETTY